MEVHDELFNEKTRHIKLINDNAEKLAGKISTMADQIDKPDELRHLVEANDKLSITLKVSDRHAPKGDVNVNTTASVNQLQIYIPGNNRDIPDAEIIENGD